MRVIRIITGIVNVILLIILVSVDDKLLFDYYYGIKGINMIVYLAIISTVIGLIALLFNNKQTSK